MKFISGDAGVAGAVQVADKMIHQVEKSIFMRIVVFGVEPEYFIASDQIIVYKQGIIPYACREQVLPRIEGN